MDFSSNVNWSQHNFFNGQQQITFIHRLSLLLLILLLNTLSVFATTLFFNAALVFDGIAFQADCLTAATGFFAAHFFASRCFLCPRLLIYHCPSSTHQISINIFDPSKDLQLSQLHPADDVADVSGKGQMTTCSPMAFCVNS